MGKNGHKVQIIVAFIGVIGALGAALITNWDKIFPERPSHQTAPEAGDQQLAPPGSSGGQGPHEAATSGCFGQYFSGLPQDRISVVEAGAKDTQLIGPHQPKDQTIAVRLDENRRPVGAVKFQFYLSSAIYKIDSVVDAQCRTAEDYRNASRGGDKHILQNWDDLQLRLGNAVYTLTFKYGAGRIDADFNRESPNH